MSWIKRSGERLKYSLEKNALYDKPDSACLFAGSAALAAISFFAYKGTKEKWIGLPLLWGVFFCSAFSSAFFLIFALLGKLEIVITEKICLLYSNVAIVAILGVVAFVLWLLYMVVHKICTEINVRIDPEGRKDVVAIIITTKQLFAELTLFCTTQLIKLSKWTSEKVKGILQYILQKFRDNRQKLS